LFDFKRLVPKAFTVTEGFGSIAVVYVTAVMTLNGVAHVFRVAIGFKIVDGPVSRTYEVFGTSDRDLVELVVNLEVSASLTVVTDNGRTVGGLIPKHS
jgi:hypothetical protein